VLFAAAVFDMPAAAVDLGAGTELLIRSASMASSLHKALLKLDRGIAERWRRAHATIQSTNLFQTTSTRSVCRSPKDK
jgi:hypothetical protein